MKKLIFGYVTKNFGDDLLIYSYIMNEKEKGNECSYSLYDVLPEFKSRVFKDLNITIIDKRLVKRIMKKFRLFRKIYFEYLANQFDELVVIGGSMFIEEVENIELLELIDIFNSKNKKIEVLGANFGPYKTKSFVKKYEEIFSKCSKVVFRDRSSYSLFKSDNIFLSTDLALTLSNHDTQGSDDILGLVPVSLNGRADIRKFDELYFEWMCNIIEFYSPTKKIRIFGFCAFENDEEIIERLCKVFPNVESYIYNGNLLEYSKNLAKCGTIISSRFHGIIFAIQNSSKSLSISYSRKTKELLNDLEINIQDIEIPKLGKLSIDELEKFINETGKYKPIDQRILAPYE